MSLSKFFKKTEIFQAQKLIPTTTPIADWKAHDLLHKESNENFSPRDFGDDASQTSFNDLIEKENEKKAQEKLIADTHAAQVKKQVPPPPPPKAPPPPDVSTPQQPPLISQDDLNKQVEKARKEGTEEGFKKGYQKGHSEGLLQGQKKASPEYESIISSLTVVFQQVETYRDNIVQNSAKEMRETILAFVEKIVRFSVKHNDATILLTLEEALQHAIKSSEFCIHINPDDYDVVQENSESFIATISGLESIVLKKNVTIERGGTYIESDNCIVDATIASQLEELYNKFKL